MHGLFRWSSKWWPGVIPLVIFWAIAAWTSTEPLEADLAQRSTAALKDTVLDKRRIAVAGRDVTLCGGGVFGRWPHGAVASVEAVPGVRLVNDETRLVPEAKPFVWSAERDVVRVTLSGSSPLPASKGRLLEAARAGLGGVEVADQMSLARGAPPRFDNAALLLLDQIGKLKDGKITLSDTKVSLSGMARELGGREAIAAALKNLPEGFSVAANDVKAPPYIFQAYKDPVAVTLTLTGYVPDNNVHAALVAAAGRKFFSEKVVDNLKASVGAPAGFANAVVPALGALSRLSTGTLVVSDREVKLSGDALYEAAAAQIRAGLGKDFPQGWQFKPEISVKPPAAPVDATVCQQLFADLLGQAQDPLRIRQGRHRRGFAGLLDRLIETALRCPTANIEIAGHTDTDGDGACQPDAVGKARAGGRRLSGQGRAAGEPLQRGRLRQHAADRRQRHRRRQGAKPPHRFRGEVSMAYLATFFWGWLLASLLLGFAMGWISVVHRGEGVSKRGGGGLRCWSAALVAAALARVVPGRFGYWLDLGLIMFALYLVGCAIGSWLRDWVVSRSAPPA